MGKNHFPDYVRFQTHKNHKRKHSIVRKTSALYKGILVGNSERHFVVFYNPLRMRDLESMHPYLSRTRPLVCFLFTISIFQKFIFLLKK